jgi:hypothetical protein
MGWSKEFASFEGLGVNLATWNNAQCLIRIMDTIVILGKSFAELKGLVLQTVSVLSELVLWNYHFG